MNDDKDADDKGAEGGESDAASKPPAAPSGDDDSPAGDTDQHSKADA